MRQDALQIYCSSNGDTWLLRKDEHDCPSIRHVPNAASGGALSDVSIGQFLSLYPSGPEHDALLRLIAGLITPDPAPDNVADSAQPPRIQQPDVQTAEHPARAQPMVDALLLAATRVCTFAQQRRLTNASGFFFDRADRLFFVTSRHVVIDAPTQHFPDRLEIELHVDIANLGASAWFSIPLYAAGRSLWRQGTDDGGEVDVAVIEIDQNALPKGASYHAFTPAHLPGPQHTMPIGTSLLIAGFPLGFHDFLHHLPVVRQAALASTFGLRFQGKGCFLTDARTHRCTSGAPVVTSAAVGDVSVAKLPWLLLGVHSSSFDVGTRNLQIDESLGLNSAWYADILMTLTSR